jgi:CubicO group peptidase (beta-lactamase class C family)
MNRFALDPERCSHEIQAWLQAYVGTGQLPGANVEVNQNGRTAVSMVVGKPRIGDDENLTREHCFQIHSMTKPLTAAACLALVEQAKFSLDDPISDYLTEFRHMKVLLPDGGHGTVKADFPITLRHLLSHTSGLAHPLFDDGPIRSLYDEMAIPADDGGPDLGDTILRVSGLPLVHQPGTRWHYGFNYQIVTHLIEKVSGMPFVDILRSEILDPLGISEATGFLQHLPQTALLVPHHRFDKNGDLHPSADEGKPRHAMHLCGHTGLFSTMGDYMKFALMLANDGMSDGRRILSKASISEIMSNQLPGTMATVGKPVYRGKSYHGHGYGFGLAVLLDPAEARSPATTGEVGCGSLASSFFWVDRAAGLSVVLLTNVAPSSVLPLRKELRQIVYGAIR